MSAQLDADPKYRDVSYLDKYAAERWECVLHYMVGSQQQEGISADAVRILLHAGLMKRYAENPNFKMVSVTVGYNIYQETYCK